jgi:site-specific recombinase XerD
VTQPLRAVPAPAATDLAAYLPRDTGNPGPFVRYLRAEGKAARTIEKYVLSVRLLLEFQLSRGYPTAVTEIQKEHVREYMAHLLDTAKSSTANTRFYALKAFFTYLLEDEEIRWHPMENMKAPPAPAPPVPLVEDDTVTALLKTCKSNSFEDRRDAAIIMLLLDTGGRVSELTDLTIHDVGDGAAHVMGKGSKPRTVFYGATTARVLDRYLRQRDRHKDADLTDRLWLGKRGAMTRWGIRDVLDRRCALAGVEHIHPHQFRHTFAHSWLADGGQETDLMRLTGWSSRSMLSRYAASAADARAAESYKKRQSPADKLKGGGK